MTPLCQQLIDLLNAIDSTPGRRRLLICGRSVYERITDDDIEWLRREHNCEILPPMEQPSQTQALPPFYHVFGRGRRRVSILRPRPADAPLRLKGPAARQRENASAGAD